MIKTVSSNEFWDYMCRPDFNRLGLHTGKCGDLAVKTLVAPEEIEGFIDSKIYHILDIIKPDRASFIGIWAGCLVGVIILTGVLWLLLRA